MTDADLGQYRFLLSCVSVVASAFTIGLFSTSGVLLTGNVGIQARKIISRGASTQAWLVSLACAVCAGIVFFVEGSNGTTQLWLVSAGLAGAMAWPLLLQEVLRASGNFKGLAILNAGPTVIFFFFLLFYWCTKWTLDDKTASVMFFASQSCILIWALHKNKLSAKPHLSGLRYLLKKNGRLGLNVYWGTFLAAITAQSGIFILQGFGTSSDVAVFALGLTVTAPLSLLPSAVGTAYFSKLPNSAGFPKGVLRNAWVVLFVIGLVFCALIPFVIHFLYGERFASVTGPAQLCGIGALLQGMGDVYNRYYLANRDTLFLLKTASLVCVAALIVGLILGHLFGPLGVAAARLVSSGFYVFFLGFHYYVAGRRFGANPAL